MLVHKVLPHLFIHFIFYIQVDYKFIKYIVLYKIYEMKTYRIYRTIELYNKGKYNHLPPKSLFFIKDRFCYSEEIKYSFHLFVYLFSLREKIALWKDK